MIGTTNPMERLAKGREIHMERFRGPVSPVGRSICRKDQSAIDTCLERCPWPDKPGMCDQCGGRPERVRAAQSAPERAGSLSEHVRRAMLLWLEWRARQPDNPDPERTREILRGLRKC